jgi:hypothetical protein
MSPALRVSLALTLASLAACTPPVAGIMSCVGACPPGAASGNDPGMTDATAAPDEGTTGDGAGDGSTADDPASTTGDHSGSSGGPPLPVDVEVFVTPSPVTAVGQVQVAVTTSRPVAAIDIFDGDVPLVLGAPPGNPVHVLDVTSDDIPGDGTHTIRAVAHAADGVSAEGAEALLIDVQPGGTDVWPPYVQTGPINGFTSARLLNNGIAVAGFYETNLGTEAIAVRIDGAKGQPEGDSILLGPVAVTGGGRGPSIAAGPDDELFVAWTRPDNGSTRWAASQVKFGAAKGPTWLGPPGTSVNALAVTGEALILAGALEISPGTHDLKVWWVSTKTGHALYEETFAAPPAEDPQNWYDEVARDVAIIGGEVVVVGEHMTKNTDDELVRRTVVLRFSLNGNLLSKWTSQGEQLEEDAAMAVAPLRAGGFVVTGWARDLGTIRQVLTRWFSAEGEPLAMRIEPTPSNDALGLAVGEDREGKIIIAGARHQPKTDANAWVLAVPGPLGPPAWEVVRNGPGQGPDEAAGLAIDA